MNTSESDIRTSFTWDYDYIVLQNEYILSDVINTFPEIINELEPIGSNGKITVCKKAYRKKELMEFLHLKSSVLFFATSCPAQEDFASKTPSSSVSCDSVIKIKPEKEFTDILKIDISKYKTNGLVIIFTSENRLSIFNKENTDIVAAISSGDKQLYYKSFALNQYLGDDASTDFFKLSFFYPLKYQHNENDNQDEKITLNLYIWNNGLNELELKNIGIWILGNPN